MTEALGWAGMNEVPIEVSLYQRAGPATWLPPGDEQEDLLFAIRAGQESFRESFLRQERLKKVIIMIQLRF
jgi:2-oxoglutarate ferredoxin oxidoreductase subunit alpha